MLERMDDDFSSEPDTVVTAYEPIGREAIRQRSQRPTELVAAGLVEERAEVVA